MFDEITLAVAQVSPLPLAYFCGICTYKNLVSGLFGALPAIGQHPAEAGVRDVYPEWVYQVLATQTNGFNIGCVCVNTNKQE
jgi:hypothetical protein